MNPMQKRLESIKKELKSQFKTRRSLIESIKKHKYASIITVVLPAVLLVGFLYFYIFKDLPNPRGLKNYKVIPISSQVLDRNGKLLFEIYRDEHRTPVALAKLPKHVVQATIAIEDKDFYTHKGVSIIGGIIRALKDTIFLRRGLQGGSTITQQLVKSALLTPERTIQRKLKEIILAVWVEQMLSKDEILELYLNQVPYGGTSYGIEEAANVYFDKSSRDLTIDEAALLAGLPKAPTSFSPHVNPDRAKRRRDEVLRRMREEKFISKETEERYRKRELKVVPIRTRIKAAHFVFYVKSLLEREYGATAVEEGGLRITTTLDLDLQERTEEIVREELEDLKGYRVSNGAALVTRPPTGEILAMVGSQNYFATPSGTFNVTTAERQPGSSIKPLHYAVALERGLITPATVYLDVPTCFPGPKKYCPRNYDGKFHGPVQMRFALANSYNIPAVKNMARVGVPDFIASSEAFLMTTFKDPKRYGVSLGLGGGEVRMTEMAQAFSSFANEGKPKALVAVLKVEDKNGKVLYEYRDSNFKRDITKELQYPNYLAIPGDRAISQETAFLISHILLDNNARAAAFGTGSNLVIPGKAVSVKTGTTNDLRDNWTIGYTPNFLTAVWVGNNDNSPMNPFLTSGVTGAAPIWNKIMRRVLEGQPDLWPRKPDGVVGRHVCSDTGGMMSRSAEGAESCPSRFEYIIKGTEAVTAGLITGRELVPVNRDTGMQTTPEDPAHEMREMTIVKDGFSTYCLDCVHETDQPEEGNQ